MGRFIKDLITSFSPFDLVTIITLIFTQKNSKLWSVMSSFNFASESPTLKLSANYSTICVPSFIANCVFYKSMICLSHEGSNLCSLAFLSASCFVMILQIQLARLPGIGARVSNKWGKDPGRFCTVWFGALLILLPLGLTKPSPLSIIST